MDDHAKTHQTFDNPISSTMKLHTHNVNAVPSSSNHLDEIPKNYRDYRNLRLAGLVRHGHPFSSLVDSFFSHFLLINVKPVISRVSERMRESNVDIYTTTLFLQPHKLTCSVDHEDILTIFFFMNE